MTTHFNIISPKTNSTFIKNTLLISRRFSLLPDISQLLYSHAIFYYTFPFVQIIIKAWKKYITVHRDNLYYLISTVPVLSYYHDNIINYYFDLDSRRLFLILRICLKKIRVSITHKPFWKNVTILLTNGLHRRNQLYPFNINRNSYTFLSNCNVFSALLKKIFRPQTIISL